MRKNNFFNVMSKKVLIAALIWLTGFFKVFGLEGAKCAPMKGKKADCSQHGPASKMYFLNVQLPGNTKPGQIELLDVSNNKFQNITFDEFPHLLILHMTKLEFKDEHYFPIKNWFLKLHLLEELDMSETKLGSSELDIIWPKKLSKLTLANMTTKLTNVFGLESLVFLEELDLNNNHLKCLPPLNESAPMKVIVLSKNPIIKLPVEQVAPYCELNSLTIHIGNTKSLKTTEYPLSSPTNYRKCIELEEWFVKFFPHFETGLTCKAPEGSVSVKHSNFSVIAMKLRNDCLAKLPATTVFELLLYAMFFSILFPILYFGNEAYNRHQARKQMSAPVAPVKHHRRRKKTTSPPEVDIEAAAETSQSEDGYEPEHEHEETEI